MGHMARTQARRLSRSIAPGATLVMATAGSAMAPRQRGTERSAALFVLVIGLIGALSRPRGRRDEADLGSRELRRLPGSSSTGGVRALR